MINHLFFCFKTKYQERLKSKRKRVMKSSRKKSSNVELNEGGDKDQGFDFNKL